MRDEPAGSSLTDTIASAAAAAYARLGNAQRASEMLQPIRSEAARAWTSAAANLCASGRASAAEPFLNEAQKYERPGAAADIAAIAHAHAKCGRAEPARAAFVRARDVADATPMCRGDQCSPAYRTRAQETVGEKIIDSGYLDLAAAWKSLRPSNEISLAVEEARSGDIAGGLRRLEPWAFIGRDASRKADAARARYAIALAGKAGEAAAALDEAVSAASALASPNQRALAFARLAEVQVQARMCTAAQPTLRAARIAIDRNLLSDVAPVGHDAARALSGFVAYLFARCGSIEEGRASVEALLLDAKDTLGGRYAAALLADSVVAALAVHRFRQGKPSEALAELRSLPAALPKLGAAIKMRSHAAGVKAGGALTAVNALIADQTRVARDYFLAAEGDLERREVLGLFASVLREGDMLDEPARQGLFERLLVETRRLNAPHWRARALCELGYTAHSLGRGESEELLSVGAVLANEEGTNYLPSSPAPGACAYWLKRARHDDWAHSVLEAPIAWLRVAAKNPATVSGMSSSELLALALTYAEAEQGELLVDWPNLLR